MTEQTELPDTFGLDVVVAMVISHTIEIKKAKRLALSQGILIGAVITFVIPLLISLSK